MSHSRIEQLFTFLREDPQDPFPRYALALEYLKMNHLDEAEQQLAELMEKQPDYLATYFQLGKVLELKKNPKAAVGVYRKGIQVALQQNNRHTLGELQGALLNLEDPDEE